MLRGVRQLKSSTSPAPGANVGPARLAVSARSNNKGNAGGRLARELLDVVQGGPKLRKWYGQESGLPRDGGEPEPPQQQEPRQQQQQQELEEDGEKDTVLVTDADTPTGELVVLQLILLRAKVRILVKDTAAAKTGYGPYVEPVSVDMGSAGGLARALRNVRSVIVLGKLGALPQAAAKAGVERLVLLSTAGMPQPGGLAGLFLSSADAALKDPQREAAVTGSGIPSVVVKAGVIQDTPGGSSRIQVQPASLSSSSSSSKQSNITREDLASAIVAGAVYLPGLGGSSSSSSVAYEVADAGPGQPPESWQQLLEGLAAARTQ
uniref:NAD(P)-binding domain-containing protein n=1 Tax=Tetradesmus obliquus TaxID=3088 RepID=A0A383V5A3_TETOB|eukprot:jgi/Sobl393_1/19785/SZX60778.1